MVLEVKVIARLHSFVTDISTYEKVFDSLSESIFESYKYDVDTLISSSCGDILEQIPSAMERLSSGEPESVNHALTTCRRIIETFADSIFPPSETIEIGGNTLSLDVVSIRIELMHIFTNDVKVNPVSNDLGKICQNLFDRVSTGVHKDVTSERLALFLNTYLFLGEVLHLEENI